MNVEQLVRQYPRLYHMSEAGSWESIQKHGLLSTSALLDLYEVKEPGRSKIESELRVNSIRIKHPTLGDAVIRDQRPLLDKPEEGVFLDRCLVGVTIPEWCNFLNRRTFFWPEEKPLGWMLNTYRRRLQWVIIIDTKALLSRHAERVTLSHINSGSIHKGKKRGIDIFQRIPDYRYPFIAELAVDDRVPDISEFTIKVEEWKWNQKIRDVWPE